MTQINKISDTPPVFPCWMWRTHGHYWNNWSGHVSVPPDATHWSPDAPTAPTELPEEPKHLIPGTNRGIDDDTLPTPSPTPQDVAAGTDEDYTEDGSPKCRKCDSLVQLREETEHTGLCDNCAQEIAADFAAQSARLAELEECEDAKAASVEARFAEFRKHAWNEQAALRAELAALKAHHAATAEDTGRENKQ